MGSLISSVVAELVMQDTEDGTINNNDYEIKFYYRCVDDTILCLKKNCIREILDDFNNKGLAFTLEEPINKQIPFFDLKLLFEKGDIETNWFQKPQASGR